MGVRLHEFADTVEPRAEARPWIGGSTVAGVLGISPFSTPLQEYNRILGLAPQLAPETESFFRARKAFEPVACDMFAERTGVTISVVNKRYADPEFSFLCAEIDAETADDENVEIKTVDPRAIRKWQDPEAKDFEPPAYVIAQVAHGLMVRNRKTAWIFAMIGFNATRTFVLERDDELDEAIAGMRAREIAFWREHIEPMIPPPPSDAGDALSLFPSDNGQFIEADPGVVRLLADFRESRLAAKVANERVDEIGDRIRTQIGAATGITASGRVVSTWKEQSSRRIDVTKLRQEMPDIAAQFTRISSTRVLRVA